MSSGVALGKIIDKDDSFVKKFIDKYNGIRESAI